MQPLPPLPAGGGREQQQDPVGGGASGGGGGGGVVGYVRARLERVWAVLEMPPAMRLDMVLHFTRRERALQFQASLEVWEEAAATVAAREAQVRAAVQRLQSSGSLAFSVDGLYHCMYLR